MSKLSEVIREFIAAPPSFQARVMNADLLESWADRIESLERDAARLDWLETQYGAMKRHTGEWTIERVRFSWYAAEDADLRAALDAAMEGE